MPQIFDAQLSEFGEYYQVVNVMFTEARYVLPNAKYFPLSSESALKIKNAIVNGSIVKIKKNIIDDPKMIEIPFNEFEITKPDTLFQLKQVAKSKITQNISALSVLLNNYDIFEFNIISARFKALGFDVFNEENKEKTFINIINTGNEELITDLERFLEVKDVFDRLIRKHRENKMILREIEECDSEEEINEVMKNM